MVYTRKTEDVYDLMYDYGYGDGLERICSCSTYKEALEDRKAYIENEGIRPKIVKHRVPIKNAE